MIFFVAFQFIYWVCKRSVSLPFISKVGCLVGNAPFAFSSCYQITQLYHVPCNFKTLIYLCEKQKQGGNQNYTCKIRVIKQSLSKNFKKTILMNSSRKLWNRHGLLPHVSQFSGTSKIHPNLFRFYGSRFILRDCTGNKNVVPLFWEQNMYPLFLLETFLFPSTWEH